MGGSQYEMGANTTNAIGMKLSRLSSGFAPYSQTGLSSHNSQIEGLTDENMKQWLYKRIENEKTRFDI